MQLIFSSPPNFSDKKVLVCDNYYQCEKCFNEAGDEIMLADEANQAPM